MSHNDEYESTPDIKEKLKWSEQIRRQYPEDYDADEVATLTAELNRRRRNAKFHAIAEMKTAPTYVAPWKITEFAMPRILAQSALFSASVRDKDRKHMNHRNLVVLGRPTIHVSGPQLNMRDALIYMAILTHFKNRGIGESISATLAEIAFAAGLKKAGTANKTVAEALIRLTSIRLRVSTPYFSEPAIQLIVAEVGAGGAIALNPMNEVTLCIPVSAAELFRQKHMAIMDAELLLGQPEFGKRLYMYVCSHGYRCHRIGYQYLKKVMDYEGRDNSFMSALKSALNSLRAIAYVGVVNPEKKVFTDNGL
jgi:hypothetical protein